MSVVTDVGTNAEGEREPTWEEAVAALEHAGPVEIVRAPRKVTVVYRYADRVFTAMSPDIKGFRVSGPSLHETRGLVRQDLDRFLDPAVTIEERFPSADPEIRTAAHGRARVNADSRPWIILPSSSGAARAFISSVKASWRRRVTS
jgi:hypothetical protein